MDFPFIKEAISQLFSKSSCAMYPAAESPAAPNYRGRIVYHPDRCIACGMCERVCSGNAITRRVEKTDEGDKITLTFNLGSCTFCATCADFCSRNAIEFTGDYHMVATKEEDLLVSGSFIKKPPAKKPRPRRKAPGGTRGSAERNARLRRRPQGGWKARQRPVQMRLLHPLCKKMPRRGHRGGQSRKDLGSGRGKMRRLRHLR